MKNIITLTLHNEGINNFETLATSKTNDLQLVELFVRNVSTERGLWIRIPDGSINVHQVYIGTYMVWSIDINRAAVVKEDNLIYDTLSAAVDFIRECLTYVLEEYRNCEAYA